MLNNNNYLVVNVWTAEDNVAIPGSNVGHISLESRYGYISLWPGARAQHSSSIFSIANVLPQFFGVRPPSFKLSYLTDSILEGKSEAHIKEISDISQLKSGETAYIYNRVKGLSRPVNTQPLELMPNIEFLVGGTPVNANVRIVLYGLHLDGLMEEFNELHANVSGWRMVGSNVLSRTNDGSEESCSSLAYRCLRSGAMYDNLNSGLSSQASSYISPDSLLRHVVAYKIKELNKNGETDRFVCPILPRNLESDLRELMTKYSNSGLSANADDDILFYQKRSSCIIM